MPTTRSVKQIDADLSDQVNLRRECKDKITRLSDKVVEATRSIDLLLAERSRALNAAVLETAHYALTRAEVEGS